jgi:polar amino acid transport system substrate-binding protein
MRTLLFAVPLLAGVLALGGCAAVGDGKTAAPPEPLLRVGVDADYPPMVFRRGGELAGLEVDLARRMAAALGRRLELVETRWDHLISGLVEGRIDIVMSAMSVTPARRLRVDFSDPYLKGGVLALMRIRDARQYDTPQKIRGSAARIGVKKDTTGDVFVQRNCPRAEVVALAKPQDAVYELKRGSIDLFIHDGYYVAWLVSENEADFTALWTPLTSEELAWAVNRGNAELLGAVNTILRRWKADGTLASVVRVWLPHGEPAL